MISRTLFCAEILLASRSRRGQSARVAERPKDHARELESVQTLGRQLSDLFDAHSMGWFASAYAAIATAAATCLSDGYDQADLNELTAMTPARPEWLDPRAPAYNLRREPWMEEAAQLEHEFRRATLSLRVIGDAPTPGA